LEDTGVVETGRPVSSVRERPVFIAPIVFLGVPGFSVWIGIADIAFENSTIRRPGELYGFAVVCEYAFDLLFEVVVGHGEC
jgi:hypothetical protein